jgi:wyosine [tRNA(Phe)-imidazoG37] synthetase (radical SAM superfamily)
VPVDTIIDQIRDRLHPAPDYITLAGSGDPTLYADLGLLIERIKGMTSVPLAVITNGALLWKPAICQALMQADLVIPSLDAGNDHLFKYINRPHPQITFDRMLKGLIDFRRAYRGHYWLEVFLLAGVSTVKVEVQYLADCIQRIQPDRVQVNTVARPPCEGFATAVPENQLEQIARELYGHVEIIADFISDPGEVTTSDAREQDILSLLKRRPCSLDDIAAGLSLHHQDVVKVMTPLLRGGHVETKAQRGCLFYALARNTQI